MAKRRTQAAALCGQPHMTYVGYEQGKAVPPAIRRAALAQALGMTQQALGDVIEEGAYEVFLRSRDLSEEGRAAARDFLRRVRDQERER